MIPTHSAARKLTEVSGIRHGFFTRQGGHSTGFYTSLNCRLGSGDDPKVVHSNRKAVGAALGDTSLVTAFQSHTPTALVINRPFENTPPVADALITSTPGLVIGVLTADCAPVLFASRDGKVIGAAHAGWKGALSGILEATLAGMQTMGADRHDIVTAIGPCIAQVSYEVGAEFRDTFTMQNLAYASFFIPSTQPDHFRFDLPGFVRHRLEQAGIGTVESLNLDTYTEAGRFFSYRRTTHLGELDYGCQASAIAIGSPDRGCYTSGLTPGDSQCA